MQQEMRYVYEIYRQKSFSKAAQALFITQPALSIAISKLEASLGMPLFDRSTRPISLTPAGRIYLQTIEKTRALEQDLRHQLDDIRALAAVGEGAIEGAITGRALYEGNFTLVQALAAARGEE